MAHGSSEWILAKQTKAFQSLRRQADFREKRLEGWVGSVEAKKEKPAAFNFRVLEDCVPTAPELSLRFPEGDVLAQTTHSFTLPRSPVHAEATEATPPGSRV